VHDRAEILPDHPVTGLVVHHLDVERDAVGMAGLRQQPPGRRGIGGRQVRIGEAEMIRRQQPPGGPREIAAAPLRQLGPVHRECHGAPQARIVERRARDVRMQPAELGRRDGIHRHVGLPARPIDPGWSGGPSPISSSPA
jgi:hypothetical protein